MSFILRARPTTLLRVARPMAMARPMRAQMMAPSMIKSVRNYSGHDESFEEFTARFEKEFEEAYDLFEVQRLLNNVFSYDLVPAPSVLEKALQACRRVNDYPTAVRLFEGLKVKVENKEQYKQYLEELNPIRKELGVELAEELFN